MAETNNGIAQNLEIGISKNRIMRLVKWVVVIGLIAGATYYFLAQRAAKANVGPQYVTKQAQIGDLTVTVTATGTLEPTNNAIAVGSEISGTIQTVEVDYNDRVKVGQVLARINTDKLKTQWQQAKSSLDGYRAKVDDAKVTVEETRKEVERLKQVHERTKGQLPSQKDMDTAVAAYDRAKVAVETAQANVSQGEATVQQYETDLSKSVIRSPVNGIVLKREIEPGQTIAASLQAPELFSLAEDLHRMELHLDIDEADVGQVKEGQSAVFTVDAYPRQKFAAKVSQLRYAATTTDGVVTYEAVLTVDNPDLLLRPGMTATADVTVQSTKNALLVPNAALRFTPSENNAASGQGESLVSNLMPRPPRSEQKARETAEVRDEKGASRVWVLRNGQPVAVSVMTGATDGKVTEVKSGDVAPGLPLIVDVEAVKQ
ncbi:MAG: efflux RND transporter periplasmic adaptor subunit [Bryobacteraceae bacterium]